MAEQRSDEKETPKIEGAFAPSGAGTQTGYQVQARYVFTEPKRFGELILDKRWKTIHFPTGHHGVPVSRAWDWWLAASHCMTYEAAQALRWWFLADVVAGEFGGRLCVETRIVAFAIKYSHSAEATSVMEEENDAWRKAEL